VSPLRLPLSVADYPVTGAGLGLRRAFRGSLSAPVPSPISFFEVAPANWINVRGRFGRWFRSLAERYPFVCHGLSLNLGGTAPLNEPFLRRVKKFLDEHRIRCYSEHLSYCADERGYLYDLMPIPFTCEAVRHVAGRIRQVQDLLERRIAIENVSYYAAPGKRMEEIDFIRAVIEEADCLMLLDVNNICVNSRNHGYDAEDFLRSLPGERIAYAHVAGHYRESDGVRVDTHGAGVSDPVWRLLDASYRHFGVFPTLVERDFNIPPLGELVREVAVVEGLQRKHSVEHGGSQSIRA